jgi:hypothetical protein
MTDYEEKHLEAIKKLTAAIELANLRMMDIPRLDDTMRDLTNALHNTK